MNEPININRSTKPKRTLGWKIAYGFMVFSLIFLVAVIYLVAYSLTA